MMPIEVYWDSREQQRLVLELNAPYTWDEFTEGFRICHAASATQTHDVTLVVIPKGNFPGGLALWRLSAIFRAQPDSIRKLIVILGKHSARRTLAESLADILQNLYPSKSRILFAHSMEEARALSASGAGVQAKRGSSASGNHPTAS